MAAADALAAPCPPCAHQDCSGGQTGAVPALSEDNGKEHGVVNPWVSSGSLHLGPSLNVGPGPFTGAVCAGGASLWLPQLPHACPLGTSRTLCPAPGRALPTAPPGMDVGHWGRCPRTSEGLWELQLGPGTWDLGPANSPLKTNPKTPAQQKAECSCLAAPEISQDARPRQGRSSWALAGWALAAPAAEVLSLPAPPAAREAAGDGSRLGSALCSQEKAVER